MSKFDILDYELDVFNETYDLGKPISVFSLSIHFPCFECPQIFLTAMAVALLFSDKKRPFGCPLHQKSYPYFFKRCYQTYVDFVKQANTYIAERARAIGQNKDSGVGNSFKLLKSKGERRQEISQEVKKPQLIIIACNFIMILFAVTLYSKLVNMREIFSYRW